MLHFFYILLAKQICFFVIFILDFSTKNLHIQHIRDRVCAKTTEDFVNQLIL